MKIKIKKCLGGKVFTSVIVGLVLLALVFMIVQCVPYFQMDFTNKKMSTILVGKYSVDGGEWKKVEPTKTIYDHFHKVTIKGRLDETAANFNTLAFSSKDIWFTLRSADGEFSISNRRSEPDTPEELFSPADRMLHTPGYNVTDILTESFPETVLNGRQDMIIEVEYPYSMATQSLSDCFGVMYCQEDGLYNQLFFKAMPSFLLFVLVCFFGLFFFPVSSFVLGKVNYKYLCFGALCFFWGLYMITQSLGDFLNLWITDVTVCLFTVRMMNYLFITMIFLYLKSNLQKPLTRAIANLTITLFFLSAAAAGVLHLTNTADLTATRPNMFINIAVCSVVLITLLCIETRGNRNTVLFLISWSPLMLTLMLDILDQYIHLAGSRFFNYGLAVTMAYQIVSLILDLQKQYKEAICYQQVQKELYEAKVNVMVSQIQPHFMYNALTSIAMMCQIDPDTAQEATITFAKYLRGNMDSLKRTAPVPFEMELEHLKKYLYIEKLRFGKKLNIEYDIQTTGFFLPQLSIQPLVENAVKHGVGMKKNGGTVTVATRETENAFKVLISDDGVGFDTSAEKKDDGRSHVGMENTKRRIKDMCGGEVIIESTVGEGTVATVILPKEEQPNENTLS